MVSLPSVGSGFVLKRSEQEINSGFLLKVGILNLVRLPQGGLRVKPLALKENTPKNAVVVQF